MHKMPLIGVSGSIEQDESKQFILRDYLAAILASGGIPLLLSVDMNEEHLQECLLHLDGLLLAGGWDIDPFSYGETPIPGLGEVHPLRDQFELRLLQASRGMKLPTLGICRGIQIMNVAAGGTLYQDIRSQFEAEHPHPAMLHSQTAPGRYPSHEVKLEAGSRLASLLSSQTLRVNSFHHQAVRKVAPTLRPCAHASDGLIEAIEDGEHAFWIGVQWHPERMAAHGGDAKALFDAFVWEAVRYARERP